MERLARGEISVEEAEKLIRVSAIDEVERYAKLDVNREARKGIPEIVFAEGKTLQDLSEIVVRLLESNGRVMVSRVSIEQLNFLQRRLSKRAKLEVRSNGRMVVVKRKGYHTSMYGGVVGILTAGTSDIPVAEEVEVVASEMGCRVISSYDVGVAGVHRVFKALKKMLEENVDVIVVVAGMEGALPSVVAGLVDLPVIGVPTSFGYGLGEKGLAALMTMLQSCSLGISVVNIDGGVAAGTVAALIAKRTSRRRP